MLYAAAAAAGGGEARNFADGADDDDDDAFSSMGTKIRRESQIYSIYVVGFIPCRTVYSLIGHRTHMSHDLINQNLGAWLEGKMGGKVGGGGLLQVNENSGRELLKV